jgi:hypothetical protein
MRLHTKHTALTLITVVALAGAGTGCSSATPTDTPGVDQLGQYLLRFKAPDVETVVGFRHAAGNLSSEWLLLELAVSSPTGGQATIKRDQVWIRTPAGDKIPLASQEEFGKAYAGLRPFLSQADVARDPMDYFPPSRSECALDFFAAPGSRVVFDQVSVNYQRVCQGRLFFKIPGGVQPGRYVLGMDLEETTIRIPFTL